MERLIVFLGAVVLAGAAASLLGRRRPPPASAEPAASVPADPANRAGEDGARACVRCGVGGNAERLIPTQEGFLCPACHDEAK